MIKSTRQALSRLFSSAIVGLGDGGGGTLSPSNLQPPPPAPPTKSRLGIAERDCSHVTIALRSHSKGQRENNSSSFFHCKSPLPFTTKEFLDLRLDYINLTLCSSWSLSICCLWFVSAVCLSMAISSTRFLRLSATWIQQKPRKRFTLNEDQRIVPMRSLLAII